MRQSLSLHCNPHSFPQSQALRLYFSLLEPWVVRSVLFPSWSLWFIHTNVGLPSSPAATSPAQLLQLQPCCKSSPPRLLISAPPTGLDECFFFNCLVVRLPYNSVVWQFWLFCLFVLNLFLSFFWLCEEAKCIYLCLHLGQKSRAGFYSVTRGPRCFWTFS